jgi:hypothetical protein
VFAIGIGDRERVIKYRARIGKRNSMFSQIRRGFMIIPGKFETHLLIIARVAQKGHLLYNITHAIKTAQPDRRSHRNFVRQIFVDAMIVRGDDDFFVMICGGHVALVRTQICLS